MKLKSTFNKFIHNKYLLYVVFLFSVLTFFAQLLNGNFDGVILFVALASISYTFTTNMILVLLVPVIIVNLFNYIFPLRKTNEGREGMENKNPDQEKIDVLTKKTKSVSNSNSPVVVPTQEDSNEEMNPSSDSSNEEFENYDSSELNKDKKKKYHIDYASTVEDAYDNLNNTLGSESMKSLTSDTKRLMEQQMQLTQAMEKFQPLVETMGPLLDKAGGLLNSMGGNENIMNLANMAKSFTSPASK
jgi:hypothetical protein